MAGQRNHYRDKGFSRGNLTPPQTMAALREMGEHVVEAAKIALKNGADIVVADAKSRCPVRTGTLRDSIQAKGNKEGTVYIISADAVSTDKKGRTFYYGKAVEFDPKINKPFLYPAMDAHRDEVYEMIKAAANAAVQRGI